MNRIIKIGMDVHSTNYTLCAMEPTVGAEDRVFGEIQVAPDYKEIILFIESLKMKLGFQDDYSIECGYEAGCLGYTLYHQLTNAGIKCVILAPTTMLSTKGKRIKTDKRDARLIAQCLCYGGYHPVYIPTKEDDAVKEYIRMRDDHKQILKSLKQQINAFVLRHGYQYSGTKWTIKHVIWLRMKRSLRKNVTRKMHESSDAFLGSAHIQHFHLSWKPVILYALPKEISMQHS